MSSPARDAQRHGGADTQFAACLDGAAMQLDQLLYQGQTDSSAFVSTGLRRPTPEEALEQPLQVFSCDATTGISHLKLDVIADEVLANPDLTLAGELEGVRHQVENDFFPHVP